MLEEDVQEEELRVEKHYRDSHVAVNKFRKMYNVPCSDPILAV